MTEHEKLMYKILGQLSNTEAPIIFKGGLITKLILAENGFNTVQRMTKDIDANWIDTLPSMSVLVDTINCSLGELRNHYITEINREYGSKQSAGISIVEKNTGDKIISMDIDIKPLIGSKTYYFGETSIKGVLANEILADKICTVSSDAVYKHRAKDIIDVYSLSHCICVNVKEIYEVCQTANREIQSFYAFFNRKSDVEHAYNKLRGVEGKPLFSDIYEYLKNFVIPFAERDFTDKIWNLQNLSWQETQPPKQSQKKMFTFSRKQLNANADKIKDNEKKKQSEKSSNQQHKKNNKSIDD